MSFSGMRRELRLQIVAASSYVLLTKLEGMRHTQKVRPRVGKLPRIIPLGFVRIRDFETVAKCRRTRMECRVLYANEYT